MKTRTNKIKITACLVFAFVLVMLCTVPAFAEMRQNMFSAEDGAVSDSGEHSPLDPEAGTVEGMGDGIIGGAQSAFDSFGDGVSNAVSDVLDIGQSSNTADQTNASSAADSDMNADNTGGNIAAAVIICIIIAIAVIILVIILIPKKKD